GAPLDAAVAHQIEGGDALGDSRRVVVARRHQGDAVAEADALRALAAGGEEDLWRRGVRVLLQEMVLDLPGVVDTEPVGELDLVESLLEEAVLAAAPPGSRDLVLVEDAELHVVVLRRGPGVTPRRPGSSRARRRSHGASSPGTRQSECAPARAPWGRPPRSRPSRPARARPRRSSGGTSPPPSRSPASRCPRAGRGSGGGPRTGCRPGARRR